MQRRNRLGSESLIRRVYATGVRVRSKGATVTGIVEGDSAPRVAIVASRRVGGAVVRNRARRRLRAALGGALPFMKPGSVAVVAATPETPSLDFQILEDSVRRGLVKAGLVGAAGA
ncbi:MAG TPA: ribonuclease P protein component [Actinomycetota bacterium]|nr:ribonuclease P protein component [Actinomycetota bacterium]